MNRKNFIASLGLVAGGTLTGFRSPSALEGKSSPISLPDIEDDLWKVIKQEFNFPEGYVYLNTGGIGTVPRHVRSIFSDAWAQLEMNPTPGHDHNKWEDLKKDVAPLFGEGVDPSEIALI